ncbi:MAG: thioredoxin domain-containing protein [Cyclobacteriaceae bacterium]|nr:thioredoxin domain-containing protein [Cyclobacteriaceae bacterium]
MTGSHYTGRKANRLIHSTSPYLLQHAYNPVDWYEWGAEALTRAERENKPILVSIGYSSCHWCHVMERESFENEDIAALMNEHLVCIKVDREERPDIDQVYMDAVQAMGLSGGWPLNVFLTPGQKPFFGGTYFPPKHWVQLIVQLSRAFRERRSEIDQNAEALAEHLHSSELSRFAPEPGPVEESTFHQAYSTLLDRFDSRYGGLDRAPKFVMPSIWQWLLRYHWLTRNPKALEMVLLTLKQLASGGIFDQLGGGFARYSVDHKWFAPHFEKMLYDNAQLLSLYSQAQTLSPHPRFQEVIEETFSWLQREMRHPEGGYFSALDADTEGEEGLFYTWTAEELKEVLGIDSAFFMQYFQATEAGNWEHNRNILYPLEGPITSLTPEQQEKLSACKRALLQRRESRTRPGLDDKILTGWNAMLITGFCDAYKAYGKDGYLDEALGIARFIDDHLLDGILCFRSFKNKRSLTTGFLEDYAHLIQAWLNLYECTFDERWVRRAESACEHVIREFRDAEDGYFFFTPASGERLISRKKDLFDNVIPSPNSVMARNLFRLGVLLDREEWKQDAIEMVSGIKSLLGKEPAYLSHWAVVAMEVTLPFFEIVVSGPRLEVYRKQLAATPLPNGILMGAFPGCTLPLTIDKAGSSDTLIHVCVNKTCRLPVKTINEALQLLSSAST